MIYIFLGKDEFSRREALEGIKRQLGDADFLEANTVVLDGGKLNLAELRSFCGTVPFFAPHRLVIVEGLLGRFEVKSPKKVGETPRVRHEQEWGGLDSYVKQMPSTTVLVLVDGEAKSTNPMLKKLSPLARVMTFPVLKGGELSAWIRKGVSQKGGSISPSAVKLLADLVGGNLWVMSNEIDKLLLYSSGRTIEEADVKEVVPYAREASIFAMIDAILEGKLGVAQSGLHRLFIEGLKAPQILVMITRQLRHILRVKEAKEEGIARGDIQSRLGLAGYALERTLAQASKFSIGQIRELYQKVMEADLSIKRGKLSGEMALELLVTDFYCSLSERGRKGSLPW